jgi:two-component sensor histidine kinase
MLVAATLSHGTLRYSELNETVRNCEPKAKFWTNAFKHARPQNQKLVVDITLTKNDEHLVLEVSDNGALGKSVRSQGKGSGFGMRLIQSLLPQLEATSEFVTGSGTTFRLEFPASRSKNGM